MAPRRISTTLPRMLLIFGLGTIHAPADLGPDAIKIVANPSVKISQISREELERIFLLTKTSVPGADHLEPVLENNGPASDLFLRQYIRRTEVALMTYYRSLVFTGKAGIPKTFDSDLQVIRYIAKTKGAIGYVSGSADTTGVKPIKVE